MKHIFFYSCARFPVAKPLSIISATVISTFSASAHPGPVISEDENGTHGPTVEVNGLLEVLSNGVDDSSGILWVAKEAQLAMESVDLEVTSDGISPENQADTIEYRGPIKMGNNLELHEFVVKKEGERGDEIIVPLGAIGTLSSNSMEGVTTISVAMQGVWASDQGAAEFTLVGTNNSLRVKSTRAFGAGAKLELWGVPDFTLNTGNSTSMTEVPLYLKYRFTDSSIREKNRLLKIGVTTRSIFDPRARTYGYDWAHPSSPQTTKVQKLESLELSSQGNDGNYHTRPLGSSLKAINHDFIQLNGSVKISGPLTLEGEIESGISMGPFSQ